MAVTPKNVRDVFPEFCDLKEPELSGHIARALRTLSSTDDSQLRDDAVLYMTAHLISCSPYGEDARIDPQPMEHDLTSTIYGRRVQSYIRQLSPTIMTV